LAIDQSAFGDRHPATAAKLLNLASYELTLKRTAQAYAHAREAHEIRKQIFGMNHPSTQSTARLLADIHRPGFRVPPRTKPGGKKRKR
jgi:hypothetical protein